MNVTKKFDNYLTIRGEISSLNKKGLRATKIICTAYNSNASATLMLTRMVLVSSKMVWI